MLKLFLLCIFFFFFFNDTATTEIYTLSLHDALPISLHLQKGNTVEKAVKLLNAEKEILFTEPYYEYELFYQPNDVLADSSEGSSNRQWYLDNIRARQEIGRAHV